MFFKEITKEWKKHQMIRVVKEFGDLDNKPLWLFILLVRLITVYN